jgi:hypothetical protein
MTAFGDHLCRQWNITGDDEITRIQSPDDFIVSDIEPLRYLQRLYVGRWRRAQWLIGDQRQLHTGPVRRTEENFLNDYGTSVCIYPDSHQSADIELLGEERYTSTYMPTGNEEA